MPQSRKLRTFPVPQTSIDESNKICVKFDIPNYPEYRQAILAQLANLGKWGNWQKDGTRKATETAEIFRRFINETLVMGDCGCADCEAIIQCIIDALNDEQSTLYDSFKTLVDTAINDAIETYDDVLQKTLDEIRKQINGKYVNGDCRDSVFSMCRQMIDFLHNRNLDFFELVEVNTNVVEVASGLATITGLDEGTILDTLTQLFNFYQESVVEQYQAVWTDTLRDELACNLFCIAKEKCGITMEDFFLFFKELLLAPITWEEIDKSLKQVLLGSYQNERIVYLCMTIQLGMVKLSDRLLNNLGLDTYVASDAKKLNMYLRSFANDSDNDWSILCDCPQEWYYVLDLRNRTALPDGWTKTDCEFYQNEGLAGGGISTPFYVGTVRVYYDIPTPTVFTKVRFTFKDYNTGISIQVFSPYNSNPDYQYNPLNQSSYDLIREVPTLPATLSSGSNAFGAYFYPSNGVLEKIEFWGEGDNPFEG